MADIELSQDELDALLGGGTSELKNLGNFNSFISGKLFDNRKNNLSTMAGERGASLLTGLTKVLKLEEFKDQLSENVVEFNANLVLDGKSYKHLYIMDPSSLLNLSQFLMNDDTLEMGEDLMQTVGELLATFTSDFSSSFAESFSKQFSFNGLSHQEVFKDSLDLENSILAQSYEITLEGDSSKKISFFEVFQEEILDLFEKNKKTPPSNNSTSSNNNQNQERPSKTGGSVVSEKNQMPNVQGVHLPNLSNDDITYDQGNIGLLMDVPMEVTVELGRAKRLIKDILSMGEGTIISLDKLAGEPIDILVNHKLIARGEVVVIDENFGVRVTEILSSKDKIFDGHLN